VVRERERGFCTVGGRRRDDVDKRGESVVLFLGRV